ncbi:unnamed protein product [Rhizopus stolonifer]
MILPIVRRKLEGEGKSTDENIVEHELDEISAVSNFSCSLDDNPMSTFNTLEREQVVAPHIDAFNSLSEFGEGGPGLLDYAARDIGTVSVFDNAELSINVDSNGDMLGNKLTYWLEDVKIHQPMVNERDTTTLKRKTYPSECRERLCTYRGRLQGRFCWKVNNGAVQSTF